MARTSRPDPDALDRILRQQIDVIARHQALAAGVSPGALRHRLRTGGPWRSLRDVRAVVADAVQRGRCTVRDLVTELTAGPNAGSILFRETLTDVADGIRSAAEGDLKDLLARSGLPTPLFNPSVYDGDTFIARPDAWWPELGVGVEVDSWEWHSSPEDHAKTLARGRRMGKRQMIVLRFTPRQIRSEPAKVIADIRDALDGARGRPPLPLRTAPAGAALSQLAEAAT